MTMNIHAHTWELLEHFRWGLFNYPLCINDDYHLLTYWKNCFGSLHFNSNELKKGVKTWLSSQVEDFFETGIQNIFFNTTSASIPAVTTMRSSICTYFFCA
jgi:hypothetical protein